jgi:hypothetical protein
MLSQRVPGTTLSWTPPLDRCPARGVRHAWMVRAVGAEGRSNWSLPLFFEVADAPSGDELAWALDILRRHTRTDDAGAADRHPAPSIAVASAGTRAPSRIAAPSDAGESGVIRVASAATIAAGSSTAHLKVAGEVRTIDPADPAGPARLWGRGRVDAELWGKFELIGGDLACSGVGGVKYGLSAVIVDWGSAADACPAGTWVCREADVDTVAGICNTTRPDTNVDARDCDGQDLDFSEAQHRGWLADAAAADAVGGVGIAISEDTRGGLAHPTSRSYPVWCCWQ